MNIMQCVNRDLKAGIKIDNSILALQKNLLHYIILKKRVYHFYVNYKKRRS